VCSSLPRVAAPLYSGFSFGLTRRGPLSGGGCRTLTTSDPILESNTAATMMLTGVRDTEPSILTLSAAGDIADP
jgi:hypothetical protein